LKEIARHRPGTESHVMQIEVRNNGKTESVQTFPAGRIIVGRSPDNEIYIKSKFVSRHHMQLVCDEESCVIEDLNSTNGVFIGEVQVKKRKLDDGDTITLGVHELIYTNLRITGDEMPKENDFEDTHDDVTPVVSETKAEKTPAA
jgi:pSer/pThr/pTyr-binding forkhead associated (FHA) protein